MPAEIRFTDKQTRSTLFAMKLEEKWNEENRAEGQRRATDTDSPMRSPRGGTATQYRVSVEEGNRYDRVIIKTKVVFVDATGVVIHEDKPFGTGSCHAFIERATSKLIKSAGWNAPAKWGKELASKFDLSKPDGFLLALHSADAFGGYLYK